MVTNLIRASYTKKGKLFEVIYSDGSPYMVYMTLYNKPTKTRICLWKMGKSVDQGTQKIMDIVARNQKNISSRKIEIDYYE